MVHRAGKDSGSDPALSCLPRNKLFALVQCASGALYIRPAGPRTTVHLQWTAAIRAPKARTPPRARNALCPRERKCKLNRRANNFQIRKISQGYVIIIIIMRDSMPLAACMSIINLSIIRIQKLECGAGNATPCPLKPASELT